MNNEKFSEAIQAAYNDPKNLYRPQTIYKQLKEDFPFLKLKQVQDFVKEQETNQVFKRRIEQKHLFPLIAHQPFQRLQIDLMFMNDFNPVHNHQCNTILVAIDVYTKYGFARAMTNKKGPTVLKALKSIIGEVEDVNQGFGPLQIDADLGSEFINAAFKRYLEDEDIHLNLSKQANDKMATSVAERFILTLRIAINRGLHQMNTDDWYSMLPDILKGYNSAKHKAIGIDPKKAIEIGQNPVYEKKIQKQIEKAKGSKMVAKQWKLGDKVRVLLTPGSFEKRSGQVWSKTVHTITRIAGHNEIYVNNVARYFKSYELVGGASSPYNPSNIEPQASEQKQVYREEKTVNRRIAKEGVKKNLHEETKEEKTERVLKRKQTNPSFGIGDIKDMSYKKLKELAQAHGFDPKLYGLSGNVKRDVLERFIDAISS